MTIAARSSGARNPRVTSDPHRKTPRSRDSASRSVSTRESGTEYRERKSSIRSTCDGERELTMNRSPRFHHAFASSASG